MRTRPQVILNIVGLTPRHIGADTPHLSALARSFGVRPMRGVFPAVTLTAQASMLTGLPPARHGAVGNGWLFRDTMEARLWQQSRSLAAGDFFYETWQKRQAETANGKVAKMFWWFNQGTRADYALTPKPYYGCDGNKIFAVHGNPPDFSGQITAAVGDFPFSAFWGPGAGRASTDWIAAATAHVIREWRPGMTLVYLPHLDYDLQRFGATGAHLAANLQAADAAAGAVIAAAREQDADITVVSEYGLQNVSRVVYPNRILREAGFLTVRPGPFGEVLETFQSRAFAVADHQIAHIYVQNPGDAAAVKTLLERTPGVGEVLDAAGKAHYQIDHPRSGELIALASPDAWFSWQYFLEEKSAPDYAYTIDIHRKPGYDPAELFFNERWRWPRLRAALKVLRKKCGWRMKFDVITHEPSRIRGSHGLPPARPDDGPLIISSREIPQDSFAMTDLPEFILRGGGNC